LVLIIESNWEISVIFNQKNIPFMKKLLFTIALLSAPMFLIAQGVGIGIKAGANFANVSSDDDDVDIKSRTRFHAGLYANINFSEKWGVTPEVLWSGQGAEIDDVEFNQDFVTVPIMLRWRIIDLISLEAGPQFNFLTNCELDGKDVKDDYKSTTYSGAFGAVVHLPLGFNGGIRYVMGLTNMADDDDVDIKDRTFQLYLGWTLGSK
jgi:hypothetical protein